MQVISMNIEAYDAESLRKLVENPFEETIDKREEYDEDQGERIINDELVWHGGMNLLGKVDAWDNLMRIRNHQVAAELLEIALS